MRRSVMVRVVLTLAVMSGALVAGCHVEERNRSLDRINRECTERLSDKEGDAAASACEAALDAAYEKFGKELEVTWHEEQDVWTFAGGK